MVNAEAREKDVKAAEAELKAETAEIEKEKAAPASHRRGRKRTGRVECQARQRAAPRSIPTCCGTTTALPNIAAAALAEVRDQKCMGCQVMLRPQTYNEVRSSDKIVVCDSCQRILYFNPANQVGPDPGAIARIRRPHPKIDASQAWYYRPNYFEDSEAFLLFMNTPSGSTRHAYDIHTGRQIGDIHSVDADYRSAFSADLEGAIRLNGHWKPDEIENWGSELPLVVMDALQRDLDAAKAESAAHAQPHDRSDASGQPAAS